MRALRRLGACAVAGGLFWGLVTTAPAVAEESADPDAAGAVVVTVAADDAFAAEAAARVATMSTRERAATVVMGHIPTTDPAALAGYMQSTGIGGFILMGANVPGSEGELRALTAALTADPALPPLIAIDQEGGDVSRLPWDSFPSAVTLKNEPPAAAQDAFAGRAALLQRAGIGVNFGVVADTTSDPSMFIYRRALGTTPDAAAERVAAAVTGEGSEAASTLKHFPGHGSAPGDSHAGIPVSGLTLDAWSSTDAAPFAAGIDAGAPLLMFGHLSFPAVDAAPATLSAEWHRIAREELGFTGVSITDDLGMLQASGNPAYADSTANAVAAIAAGSDMVLAIVYSSAETAPRMVDGIAAAVDAGTIAPARLEEAATRVIALRLQLGADGRGLMPCADCAPVG
ncbi:glycoside hydrolase family 3 N-terminal domain-containing protein [Microbacterium aoyamense]|uniref:Glycoside hydrolase family 3 N-terminal domain-containing protein n=1 Tax=Microbacterium aoyamense TaxID=344166 RepID=A0ABN2P679_9MICO|nr:glycoside hydrolase family 3 N-terminal domain-containing protein [Microbacterium aoyamense]